MNRTGLSKIRVLFDTPRAEGGRLLTNSDLEVVILVSASDEDQYRVDIDTIVGAASSDMVTADSFIPVLSKRRKYKGKRKEEEKQTFSGPQGLCH